MTCGSPTLLPVVKLEKGVRGLPASPYFPKFDFVLICCDKSVRNRNEERGTGTRIDEPERGTRLWNKARETLRPCPNSVTTRGNEDPPCVYMGGRVTLFLDV